MHDTIDTWNVLIDVKFCEEVIFRILVFAYLPPLELAKQGIVNAEPEPYEGSASATGILGD